MALAALKGAIRSGAAAAAVACDACGGAVDHDALPARREEASCPRCGSLVLPFAPFARSLDGEETTVAYDAVLPLPEHDPLAVATPAARPPSSDGETVGVAQGSTLDYAEVLALPGGAGPRSEEQTVACFTLLLSDDGDEEDAAPGPRDAAAAALRRIGPYRLERALGQGASGQVFLARGAGGQQVALKVLRPEAARDEEFLTRFLREARAAERVRHPNVVGVVDAGCDEGTGLYYLALEHVAGGSLETLLARVGALEERRALEIALGVARALEAAEQAGVVHRDVKPDNILLSSEGVPKLADLGLAKQLDATTQITETGVVVGTPVYIAPEQARDLPLDSRSDLYALGLVLWEMLTGEVPFADEKASPMEIIMRHLREELLDPRVLQPTVSPGAAMVVRWLAAKDRDARYPRCAASIADLERVLRGEPPLGPGGASTETAISDPHALARASTHVLPAVTKTSPASPPASAPAAQPPPAPARSVADRLVTVALVVIAAGGGLALLLWAALWARHLLG